MNILVTGANGQLGSELIKTIESGFTFLSPISDEIKNANIIATDVDTLDITNLSAVLTFVSPKNIDVIINCAAYTNVDKCETEQDLAMKINAIGARNLSIAADKINAKIVHISTDYVFSGKLPKKPLSSPLSEWDLCKPKSIYGVTKLLGEQYVRDFSKKYFILRTAWLYGLYGNNIVKAVLKVGEEKGALTFVNDQFGNPTNAADLVHHIIKLISTEEYGVYHCTCSGECSWFDFASEIIRLSKINCTVTPCSTAEFPRPAPRPAYSSLDNAMLRCTVGDDVRDWKVALADFMKKYLNK